MPDQPNRILILSPNPVGDAVMFTPSIRAIRARFPEAELTLLARPAAAAVLTPNPWGARVLIERGRLLETVAAVRTIRADMAVIGPNSFRGGVLARLSGAARRVGYARDGRGWMLTDPLKPPRRPDGSFAVTPAIDYYLALAERLGCDVSDRRMELSVADADAASAEDLLARKAPGGGPLVLLNPGAAFGGSKLYPAGRFAAVADAMIDRYDARIVINAGPGEGEIAAAVVKSMNRAVAINLAAERNSLGLVKALTARGDLMITNDTGPRHFAAAFGAAVVTIFGATDPGWTTIYYDRERIVRVDTPCGPCQQKECRFPPGHPEFHQCMLNIPPEMVIAAAEDLLRDHARPGAASRGGTDILSARATSVSSVDGNRQGHDAPATHGQDAHATETDLFRRHGLDTVEGAFAFAGGRELKKPGLGTRRRVRLELTDADGRAVTWYLKRYGPIPWTTRLWRCLTGRGKTSPASREYVSVNALRDAGVPTMRALICGRQRGWLGDVRSYLVVTGVPGEALERCMARFLDEFGDDEARMAEFNAALVDLVAGLHAAGHVHRDLYASHIFLDVEGGRLRLYLIDLARVFAPRWRDFRWRVKDLAQLKSSMPAAWVGSHWDGFLSAYLHRTSGGGRICGMGVGLWAEAIDRKVAWMRRRAARKAR